MKFKFFQDNPKLLLEVNIIIAMTLLVYYLSSFTITDLNKIIITLGLFAFASVKLLPSTNRIYRSFQLLKFGLPSINLIYSEINNQRNFSKTKIENSNEKKLPFTNQVVLKNVSFSYGEKTILKKLISSLKKGKLMEFMVEQVLEKVHLLIFCLV